MKYVGIDPGAGGALASIKKNGNVKIYDVPTVKVKVGKRMTKDYDLPKCVELLKKMTSSKYVICLEKVQAMPLNGSIANFAMGRGRGVWEGIAASLGIDVILVSPATWKSAIFGKRKTKVKKKHDVSKALKLYPKASKYFQLKKHHDRADALLLAHYAKKGLANGKVQRNKKVDN